MRKQRRLFLWALLSTTTAYATPYPIMRYTELRVRAIDEHGKPVLPERLSCEVVYYPPVQGRRPLAEPCAEWKYVLQPSTAPDSSYRPFEFKSDGNGVLRLPGLFGRRAAGSIAFIRAHAAGRSLPATLVLENSGFANGTHEKVDHPLLFRSSLGKPPVLTEAPTLTVLSERTPSLVPVQLKVRFEDPEKKPLRVFWFLLGPASDRHSMETRADLPLGRYLLNVVACDPESNCTHAGLAADVKPLSGFEPENPLVHEDKELDVSAFPRESDSGSPPPPKVKKRAHRK